MLSGSDTLSRSDYTLRIPGAGCGPSDAGGGPRFHRAEPCGGAGLRRVPHSAPGVCVCGRVCLLSRCLSRLEL